MSRVFAIDYGTKRTGTAISDETGTLARPVAVVEVRGPKQLANEIAELVIQNEASEVVLGLPLKLDGQPGEHADAVQDLARRLRGRLNLPLHLVDERFTTSIAERSLLEAGRRGAQKKLLVDCAAATVLLQSFLDARKGPSK